MVADDGGPESHETAPAADDADTSDGDSGWRFEVSDLPADAESEAAPRVEEDEESEEEEDGNVAGQIFDLEEEITPGSPSMESAFFVFLGAFVTILFILTAAGLI